MRRASGIALLVFVIGYAAQAAEPLKIVAYATVRGTKSGQWNGEVTMKPLEKTIALFGVGFEAISPRDAASGLPTGRRQYKPLTIVKEMDSTSPLFFNALATNENLTDVKIDFYRPDPGRGGVNVLFQTVELNNASVSNIRWSTGYNDAQNSGGHQFEEVSITFQKITITNAQFKTMGTDSWSARQ